MRKKLMVVITCLVLLICLSVGTVNAIIKVKSPKNKATTESSKKQTKPNKYSIAGIDDPVKFEKNFNLIKELVAKGKKSEVAKYIEYPLNVYTSVGDTKATNTKIYNKSEFIKKYDTIMTVKVKKALKKQKLENIFINYEGVMVGNGEIWLGQFKDNKKKYCIYVINN